MTEYGGMILVRYAPDFPEYIFGTRAADYLNIKRWIKSLPYDVEWAYIDNRKVGFFVTPEDATYFALTFGYE